MVECLLPKQKVAGSIPVSRSRARLLPHATLAQLVEQCFRKAEVPGSNPGSGSIPLRSLQELRGINGTSLLNGASSHWSPFALTGLRRDQRTPLNRAVFLFFTFSRKISESVLRLVYRLFRRFPVS